LFLFLSSFFFASPFESTQAIHQFYLDYGALSARIISRSWSHPSLESLFTRQISFLSPASLYIFFLCFFCFLSTKTYCRESLLVAWLCTGSPIILKNVYSSAYHSVCFTVAVAQVCSTFNHE
jgi:hypothetical protein